MHKILVTSTLLMIMSIGTYAGGNILSLPMKLTKVKQHTTPFLKTVSGHIRFGYQKDNNALQDIALGGKLHIQTQAWHGLWVGASFYTTNSMGKHEGAGVPFFDANKQSYSILAEAYIAGSWGHTTIKVGRQKIDTPFADTDDIGMVPNTFEAIVLTNTDLIDTTLFLAHLQRYSGVDSPYPEKFNTLHENKGVQVLGIRYEGLKNSSLEGWYYHMTDSVQVGYLEATYAGENRTFFYEIAAQYALQKYEDNTKSSIYGLTASLGLNNIGLSASVSYNNVDGRAADNFFGGGPYFTNAEHHTLTEAGEEGSGVRYGLEWDTSHIGMDGLRLSTHFNTHTNPNYKKTKEYDFVAAYTYSDTLNFTAIYSDINHQKEAFTNLRVFANYSF